MIFDNFLSTIGAAALAFILFRVAQFIRLACATGNISRYRHNGSYALVTGSTDGIGKELAFGLAERGFNVILHGRNPTKLEAVKTELQSRFPRTKLETVLADISTADPAEVADKIAHLPVSVLINNAVVGLFDGELLFFNVASHKQAESMISGNVRFPALLARAMIPRLAQPALIVNVSSFASELALCKYVLYGATKTFLNALTAGVRREVARQGMDITVQTLQVGLVSTKTAGVAAHTQPAFLSPPPDVYARAVLGRVGGKQLLVMGYPWHTIPFISVILSPMWISQAYYDLAERFKSADVPGQTKDKAQ
ncbi:hypothetical protein BOTBODRAFT_167589 [Botryobasidium botryosum FD-172 SS1]|uniref:Uncharacterized protein n=1 Tax=Botryobasidium botryosum (strain FD-172 SS1) TaxID=930990 RepID=A0A067M4Z2_BOTB1|nr:hypothetical protein BOTBODRAFT_167589 [Botryobasidium botryosum FD-172 SS1]